MKLPKKFSLRDRGNSFRHAFYGLWVMAATQHNARIHFAAAAAVLAMAWFLNVGAVRTCVLLLSIAFVISAEALNTAIEVLATMVSPQYSEKAGRAKDVAAAAVLAAAIGSALTGLMILGPPLLERTRQILTF